MDEAGGAGGDGQVRGLYTPSPTHAGCGTWEALEPLTLTFFQLRGHINHFPNTGNFTDAVPLLRMWFCSSHVRTSTRACRTHAHTHAPSDFSSDSSDL